MRFIKNVFTFIFLAGIFFIAISGCLAQDASDSFVYDSRNRRDPFWPLISASGTILSYEQDLSFSDLTLEGITFDPQGRSIAVINSTIVKNQQEIGGYVIVEIRREEVLLSKEGKKYILKMRKE